MKGVAIRTIILLVLAVIVMAIALWFLIYVTNFDALFLSNDQRILKQYSTCALAYCAAGGVGKNGQTSDEVQAVGCLKSQGGNCVLTCAQVEKEVFQKNNVKSTVYEVGGRGAPHYCGPEAALTFEFSGVSLGGTVPLRSGQMDKLATSPQWVCKPIKVPFTDVDLDSIPVFNLADTAFAQFTGSGIFPQNCIILSGRKSLLFPGRDGCFLPIKYDKSYDSIYYTPIIEYDSVAQIIYPSGIYVDKSFTNNLQGSSNPECNYQNQPNHDTVTPDEVTAQINKILNTPASANGRPIGGYTWREYYDTLGTCKSNGKTIAVPPQDPQDCKPNDAQKQLIEKLAKENFGDVANSDGNNLIGNVLNSCNFKTTYEGKKIVYSVWAKPVYPTLDALQQASGANYLGDSIQNLLKSIPYVGPNLANGFTYATEAEKAGLNLILSQLGGSCTAVILGRDLPQSASSNTGSVDVVQDLTISTDHKTYPAGGAIKFSGQITMASGSTSDRIVTVDFQSPNQIGTGSYLIKGETVTTDSEGKFSGEFQISKTSQGGIGYILQASFLGKTFYSNPFNIGG